MKFLNGTFINFLKVKLGTQSISPDENGFLNFRKICTETLSKINMRHVTEDSKGKSNPVSIRKFQRLL